MKITHEMIVNGVRNYFKPYYGFSDDFQEIVVNILERIEKFSNEPLEDIFKAMDEELIYTWQQWEVLKAYCNPEAANWEEAIEALTDDIQGIVIKILKDNKK